MRGCCSRSSTPTPSRARSTACGPKACCPQTQCRDGRWALLFSPQECFELTKTGDFDDTVAIDNDDIDLTRLLESLKQSTEKHRQFVLDRRQRLQERLRSFSGVLGPEDVLADDLPGETRRGESRQPVPSTRTRTSSKRGFWKAYASLRRYEKNDREQNMILATQRRRKSSPSNVAGPPAPSFRTARGARSHSGEDNAGQTRSVRPGKQSRSQRPTHTRRQSQFRFGIRCRAFFSLAPVRRLDPLATRRQEAGREQRAAHSEGQGIVHTAACRNPGLGMAGFIL